MAIGFYVFFRQRATTVAVTISHLSLKMLQKCKQKLDSSSLASIMMICFDVVTSPTSSIPLHETFKAAQKDLLEQFLQLFTLFLS